MRVGGWVTTPHAPVPPSQARPYLVADGDVGHVKDAVADGGGDKVVAAALIAVGSPEEISSMVDDDEDEGIIIRGALSLLRLSPVPLSLSLSLLIPETHRVRMLYL